MLHLINFKWCGSYGLSVSFCVIKLFFISLCIKICWDSKILSNFFRCIMHNMILMPYVLALGVKGSNALGLKLKPWTLHLIFGLLSSNMLSLWFILSSSFGLLISLASRASSSSISDFRACLLNKLKFRIEVGLVLAHLLL